jgi:hypothetical protein
MHKNRRERVQGNKGGLNVNIFFIWSQRQASLGNGVPTWVPTSYPYKQTKTKGEQEDETHNDVEKAFTIWK